MLEKLNEIYPVRYTAFLASVVLLVFTLLGAGVTGLSGWWPLLFLILSLVGLHDLKQEHHAVLRNYPVIGHLRFMLEYIRPEIRQYFLESETDATPFSRAQRSLVYSRAKGESDKRPLVRNSMSVRWDMNGSTIPLQRPNSQATTFAFKSVAAHASNPTA